MPARPASTPASRRVAARRGPRAALALVLLVLLTLVGCAGGGDSDLPTVTGEVGEAPEVTFPEGEPPTELQTEVLVEGDGPEVAKGDTLVADYAGYLWDATEPFDTSYDADPVGFSIGVGGVIKGWDQGLVGQKVGSRVLLVIPPDLGYGAEGSGETIPPDSTLTFVVDIVNSIARGATGTPVEDLPAGLPTVTGEQGAEPAVAFDGAKAATKSDATLLIAGSGAEIPADANLVVDVVQYEWDGKEAVYSSWPQSTVSLTAAELPGLAEALKGQGAGSRVLIRVSEKDNPTEEGSDEGTALALVVDVHGSY